MFLEDQNLSSYPAVCFIRVQYRHDQSRLSTGHGIGVLFFKMNTVTGNSWLIHAAATEKNENK